MIKTFQTVKKAVRISGLYVEVYDPKDLAFFKHDLTIGQRDYITEEYFQTSYYLEGNTETEIWLPRNYPLIDTSLIVETSYDNIVSIPTSNHSVEPRDSIQKDAIEFLSNRDYHSAILSLPPGFGKTVITVASIANLKTKSMVIVDSRDLAKQWVDQFKRFTNLNAEFDSKLDLCYDVNVVTIQKLLYDVKKDSASVWNKVYNAGIGVVAFDEVHVLLGPELFTTVAYYLPIPKWIFISATPFRQDGTGKILQYWMGDNIFSIDKMFKVSVLIWPFTSNIPLKSWRWVSWSGKFSRPRYLKKLKSIENYFKTLLDVAFFVKEQGRKVLYLFEHIDLIDKFAKMLDENGIDYTLYYGNHGRENLQSDFILATYSKCSKAIDIPHIDTLVYATPISNEITLEQSKGRIQRQYKDKKSPLIIDIVDVDSVAFTYLKSGLHRRLSFYKSRDYDISFAKELDSSTFRSLKRLIKS